MARDPHLRARSSDRKNAVSAIQTAYARGLIGDADRTLRVANAEQAITVGELDLLTRDLSPADAPTTTSHAASAPGPASATPAPGPASAASAPGSASDAAQPSPASSTATNGDQWTTYAPPAQPPSKNAGLSYVGGAPHGSGLAKLGGLIGVAMFVIVAATSGMIANFGGEGGASEGIEFGDPDFVEPDFSDPDFSEPDPNQPDPGGPGADEGGYELSAPGVDAFLGLLEAELGTSSVLRAVFYPEYASVDVPTDDGRRRQESWVYRDGAFTRIGEPRASTAGDQSVDLRELSLDGLQVSLDHAVHTLGVESPTTTYAIVSHTWAEDQATVSIHVGNEFSESAHLTTDLEGTELRRFPFGS